MKEVKLSNLIAPSFYGLHVDIRNELYTHYWLKGGRGSAKSSFISMEIILGIMKDSTTNAVVLRKIGHYLKDSVFEQLQWAIQALGVEEYWHAKRSPLELIYISTGQRIIFRGADKPKKIKSTKVKKGYIKYIWFEEVDEFNGSEEIRIINQTLMRGGDEFCIFYSYNPPKSQRNWVNKEVLENRPDRIVHHSTYLTVPRDWLGEQFFIEAEHIKKTKPEAYEHEYMGAVTGTGGEVFRNIKIRQITDEEISAFEHIKRGLDWAYAVDPLHYTVNHYDKTRKRLYIFYEINKVGMSFDMLAEGIKRENKFNFPVTADSAEPRSNQEMRDRGIRIRAAKKGPGSVEHGMKWLQDLEEIIIDPIRCPETAKEFTSYEYGKDSNGNFRADFPDKNNHSIDAVRYSREDDMQKTGVWF